MLQSSLAKFLTTLSPCPSGEEWGDSAPSLTADSIASNCCFKSVTSSYSHKNRNIISFGFILCSKLTIVIKNQKEKFDMEFGELGGVGEKLFKLLSVNNIE